MSYSVSMNMQQKPTQSLKQTQRLIMSPQMQQAIHLLQMPVMELSTVIEAELERNPVLDIAEAEAVDGDREIGEESSDGDMPVEQEVNFDDKDFEIMRRLDEEFRDHFSENAGYTTRRSVQDEKLKTFLESSIKSHATLFECLMAQARETFEQGKELDAAEAIIGNLDERGFLGMPLEEVSLLYSLSAECLEKVLQEIQTFEPYGIAAKDVRESLLIQFRQLGKEGSLAYQIVENFYEDLLYNRVPLIKKKLGVSSEEIQEAIHKEIANLNLYPGNWEVSDASHYITADVTVASEGGEFRVFIEEDGLPSLCLNSKYIQMLSSEELPEETREYIRNKVASGKWLLRNIHQRNDTLIRITQYLVRVQKEFFLDPKGKLSPLTMKTVAEELGIHESTVARAVSNKYVDCFRGLLPLRSFFTNAYATEEGEISSRTVKELLQKIVSNEEKSKPLSDEAISVAIKAQGIPCARRTVAKYRRELKIGNASQRRVYL